MSERLDALGDAADNVRIIGMIESAHAAAVAMPSICTASPHRLDALIFGSDDYAASVGATRTAESTEMDFPRNWVLMQAAAFGIEVIDMVQIDLEISAKKLQDESRKSFELGFTGKQVIHPKQIEPVQAAYSPITEAINHAAAVVQANQEHQDHGRGAFSFNGKMIDMPTVKQFENLLEKAKLMGLYPWNSTTLDSDPL